MYLPLPTPEEMAAWDQKSSHDFGLWPEILMENASREAFRMIKRKIADLPGRSALVFAGSGNNGGDAFALARHLWNHDVKVMILHSKRLKEYKGAAGYHLSLLRSLDIPHTYLYEYNLDFLKGVDIIVDGLLGTGFRGELREGYDQWIKAINKLGRKSYIVSLDIPSGIDGITGKPSPVAVMADDTIAFEEAKIGLFQPEARQYVGCLNIAKIGIPQKIKRENPPVHYALDIDVLSLLDFPKKNMHKKENGHVLVLGGSQALSGAAVLACMGALRAGSGLVTLGCPAGLVREIRSGWPEIMTLPLGDSPDWNKDMLARLKEELPRFDSVVIGPGMGRKENVLEFIRGYLDYVHPRTLFDADALYWLAQDESLLRALSEHKEVVLTPHPGELARFYGISAKEINTDRCHYAREFTSKYKFNLVLKGACTIIFGNDQHFYISPFAVPNLAVGGSGDVLSGVIASLMGRKMSTLNATNLGVYWHGLAGKELEKKYPFLGNLAREIAESLPAVMARFKEEIRECDSQIFW